MDSITSITVPVDNFEFQTFTSTDTNLIGNQEVEVVLNTNTDSVEYYLYDQNQQLLEEDYNFIGWQTNADSTATDLPDTLKNVNLDPEKDVLNSLPSTGKYYPFYTFVRNKFLSSTNSRFYIDSISGDRKELTIKTNNLTPEQLTSLTEEFLAEADSSEYFKEFYLNFGENQSIIGLDLRQEGDTLKIKLYLPLSGDFQTKSTFWIQFRVADPIAYEVDYLQILTPEDTTLKLRGPNLNIERKKDSPNSTEYKDKTQLDFTYSTGSRAQLSSLLQEKGIELNIDYTDYSNFVHFSSATQRLQNFYYKVQLIESGSNRINEITGSTMPAGQQSQSIASLQGEIDRIITNFDGYDYYLYYESGSKAWPKTNSTKPYTLASTGSVEVIAWYGTEGLDGTGQLQSASLYDNENQDNLVYSIPEFIREDSANAGYELFIEMIGQHFDNLYLYTEAITQKYNADNRLDYGVSKDLVADTLRSFGVKLYENNFSTDDLYTALIGLTPEGSTLPLPSISTTFPVTGSGLEYIETIISASNEVIPLDDLNKSIYKRLYHNLPALVKKKGTAAGLRNLINAFGIPDTILRINEFGGKDKNPNTWDYDQNEYDYAFNTSGDGFVNMGWENSPFEFTINTANTSVGSSNSDQFQLPLVSSLPLNAVVDWGDGSSDTVTVFNQAETTHTYASSGTYTVSITGDLSGWQFAAGGDRLKMLNVLQWSGLNISVGQGFQGCTNLTATATDTPIITSTSLLRYFQDCTNFNGAIGNWDMSNVTSMNRMFRTTPSFNQPIGNWSVQNVTVMLEMFEGATAFNQDIGSWNVSNVSNFTDFMNGKTAANYSAANLDSIYNGWSSRPVQPNISIKFGSINYTAAGQAGKDVLTNAPNNWTITDGGI